MALLNRPLKFITKMLHRLLGNSMIAQQISQFHGQLEQALRASDLTELKDISSRCDLFLRTHLPLQDGSDEDIELLAGNLENLLAAYRAALTIVETAKSKAGVELQSVTRNKAGASKYLDVAGSFRV